MQRPKIFRQFYELEAKSPEEVRKIWNYVHIFLLAISFISGLTTAYAFGLFQQEFDFRCFFFSKLEVKATKSIRNLTTSAKRSSWNEVLPRTPENQVDFKRSRWGVGALCSFFQFLHICSMLSALIWMVFIVISGRGSRKSGRQIVGSPYRLVIPFFCWSIISVIVIFATNSIFISGLHESCAILEDPDGESQMVLFFGEEKAMYEIFFGDTGMKIYLCYVITKYACYIGLFAWASNALWTLLRFYLVIDFKIFLITVWKYVSDNPQITSDVVPFSSDKEK
ncbi:hypothetical protein HHI36_018907 [Cryptolaemus montrouzieri]|uniref:Uncharacterized protein n=1 Tax=Cryptolaemus montrouzieri TaxID=559131 RepID=A0ABD2P1A3_9CUCU